MSKIVRIGGATGAQPDSRTGIVQLLAKAEALDYIIFDFLAESIMGGLGRGLAHGTGTGFEKRFADSYILPNLQTLLDRGVRVVANAGGLDPESCADTIRRGAQALGLNPRIGVVAGDDLTARRDAIVDAGTTDMFDGSRLRDKVESADAFNSLVAYTGAFPVAAALAAGADIVITGRAVDSAMALGPLIHEFGWGPDDFDQLAAGTLAGHLLECSAQVTGGTFTDWRDVPDWAGIGMPIGECEASGEFVITKPPGTGGLVSVGTVSEQLLYEVNDPQRYYVPDVICDFSAVELSQVGADRVRVTGAKGLGRTGTYKASLTYEKGWRVAVAFPIVGLEASDKAKRSGMELFARTNTLLRQAQLPPLERMRCEAFGGEGPGPGTAICRIVADHADRAGAQMLLDEHGSAMLQMSVGTTMALGSTVRPIQHIAGFLIPKSTLSQTVTLEGEPVAFTVHTDSQDRSDGAPVPTSPAAVHDADPQTTVPLIKLAWARSGDKGNLFNVAVIAREPSYLPYIAAALTPETIGDHYARVLGQDGRLPVDRYDAPGMSAINFVVRNSMEGGIMASTWIDPVAKGMAQLLLDYPIPVSAALKATLGG